MQLDSLRNNVGAGRGEASQAIGFGNYPNMRLWNPATFFIITV